MVQPFVKTRGLRKCVSFLIVVCSILLTSNFCFFLESAGALEILRGKAIQGGLLIFKTDPGNIIRINGQKVTVSSEGFAAGGFHRNDTKILIVEAVLPNGQTKKLSINPEIRKYTEQRISGLPNNMVNPPSHLMERIHRERKLVISARSHDTPLEGFSKKFVWPVIGIVTGTYGSRRILNGKPRSPHYGIDIAAPSGTKVFAPQSGIIRMVAYLYFTGWTVILDHGHGLSSTFLHLRETSVSEGNAVKQGDAIGAVGSTGRSTGAHLDWRINLFEKRLDPFLVAGPMPTK
ncbi:MAG: M23 family metallopeptidase [Pseudomonadota bacterium]|nr:M23 family metallopeptidase [Pseudomonadota bacterium]